MIHLDDLDDHPDDPDERYIKTQTDTQTPNIIQNSDALHNRPLRGKNLMDNNTTVILLLVVKGINRHEQMKMVVCPLGSEGQTSLEN